MINNIDASGVPLVATPKELAEILRLSESHVRVLARQGMPCFYAGKVKTRSRASRPRFVVSECIRWLKERQKMADLEFKI